MAALVVTVATGAAGAGEVVEYLSLSEGREWSYQVEKIRTIMLPDRKITQEFAGTFKDCLRISTRGPISGELPAPQPMPIQEGSIEETLWFAKGAGLVKQVQIVRMRVSLGNDQQLETVETKTKTLTAYEQ